MTNERKLRATIKTGELTQEEYDRLIAAVGSVVANESFHVKTTEVRLPKEKPVYPSVPEELKGMLGSMGIEEFIELVEASSENKENVTRNREYATRLWNALAFSGFASGQDNDPKNPYFAVNNSKNWRSYEATTEKAIARGFALNLDYLAEVIEQGTKINNAGLSAMETYSSIVQHRVAQIQAEMQTTQSSE